MTIPEKIHQIFQRYSRTSLIVVNRDRMEKLVRLGEAGLVLCASDLSRYAQKQIFRLCEHHQIPCRIYQNGEYYENLTHVPNAKVITFRKSFPNLEWVIQQLDSILEEESSEANK